MTSITDEELALALPVDYEPREDCSAASSTTSPQGKQAKSEGVVGYVRRRPKKGEHIMFTFGDPRR